MEVLFEEWGAAGIFFTVLRLFLPCLVIMWILGVPVRAAFPVRLPRLAAPGVFCTLGMSIIGITLAAVIGGMIQDNFGVSPTMPDFSPPYGMAATIIYMISLSIIPAVFEELLFRGVILQSLRHFGDGFALIVSSILFAFLHGNLVQAPNAFLVGLVLGYFALRSGSIFTPIIMHFANNAFAAIISVAGMYLPPERMELLGGAMVYSYLSLGILGIVIMISRHGGFIRPLRRGGSLRGWEKYTVFFTAPVALVFIAAASWLIILSME